MVILLMQPTVLSTEVIRGVHTVGVRKRIWISLTTHRTRSRGGSVRVPGSEDPRLVLWIGHVLALEEPVEAVDLKLQPIELLPELDLTLLHLRVGHLQRDKPLLCTLLRLRDTAFQAAASLLDLLSQSRHHLLQILEHGLQGNIGGLLPGAERVVERIRLHGSNESDTNC
jgi:hypothetical protein